MGKPNFKEGQPHYYTTIIVRLSVMEGQWKQFDLETPVAVSRAVERRKLELRDICKRQSWH